MSVLLDRRPRDGVAPLVDPFARRIRYLRVSVTDRCDLRCVYCMPERMQFAESPEVLSFAEIEAISAAFIAAGVSKIRLTGGEPLVRRGVLELVERLSAYLGQGLEELALTTNGTQLARYAADLARLGLRRVNVSLDSLDPTRFAAITRGGELARVLDGIAAAKAAGLKLKINIVALKDHNAGEIPQMIAWAHGEGFDVSLIEVMPMGEVEEDRTDQFLSLAEVRRDLSRRWRLVSLPDRTGGPSRYVRVEETGGRLGFITPLSHVFCEDCNRVRLTATGKLFLCLGQTANADLRAVLRGGGDVGEAIRAAMGLKPERHDFSPERLAMPAVERRMSETGG